MASFILQHAEQILVEWEAFANSLFPASITMDSVAFRDHARRMLEAIASDIETPQSEDQQALKSKGRGPVLDGVETAAAAHGVLRHAVGFDLRQLVAEFRALRASVLRTWLGRNRRTGRAVIHFDVIRFNEAVDQALAESIATYSDELAKSRANFLTTLGDDLRRPLSAMSGALNIFSGSGGDASRAEVFAVGTRSVSSMSGMIRDMSEYTRTHLERGISIAPCAANLENICKTAISEVSLVYPQTSFRFEAGGNLEGVFDRERIHQMVSNLLSNGVQSASRGTPIILIVQGNEDALTLSVTTAEVRIVAVPMHEIVACAPGTRLDPADTGAYANLGLAMFMAREIALAHGGTIHAASAGSRTTFTVVLPRAAAALARLPAGARVAGPPLIH
jgi:signal transduction histidine kinase